MIANQKIFLLLLAFLFTRCAWTDEQQYKKVIDDYYVGWSDLPSNNSIVRFDRECEGCSEIIVEAFTSAIGHNERYIIAKQITNGITGFYIIDTHKKYKDGVIGPVSSSEFEGKLIKLGIANIRFDQTFQIAER